jgi:CRP-like cAMP-binding protein
VKEGELGRIFHDGEIIFREGDEGDRMYVVQSGKVKITKKTPEGEVAIATLGNGEIFGEMALFDRMPRSATAEAVGEARVLGIDKKKLFQSIDKDPTIVFRMLLSMSQRIRRLNEEFTELKKSKTAALEIFVDVDEICTFILNEAKNFIRADNGSVMLFDQGQDRLVIKAAFGAEWEPKASLGMGEGLAGDVLQTGKAELVNNVSMDSRFKSGAAHIASILCVPLKWKDSCFGVINMSKDTALFTIEDLKLLRFIAIYASIAIENAMNFSRLKEAADTILRNAALLDIW